MSQDTSYNDLPNKADFFSVFLQEKMGLSLQQSLSYMIKTFISKQDGLHILRPHTKKLSMIFDILINGISLFASQAFFTEFFYKLKRFPPRKTEQEGKLKFKKKISLICLYVVRNYVLPFLKNWSHRIQVKIRERPTSHRKYNFLLMKIAKLTELAINMIKIVNIAYQIK